MNTYEITPNIALAIDRHMKTIVGESLNMDEDFLQRFAVVMMALSDDDLMLKTEGSTNIELSDDELRKLLDCIPPTDLVGSNDIGHMAHMWVYKCLAGRPISIDTDAIAEYFTKEMSPSDNDDTD